MPVEPAELSEWRANYPILARTSAYLINNSLGAMHRGTRDRLAEFADLWDTQGVVAWGTWFPEMTRVADLVGAAIGAPPGSTLLKQSVADALAAVGSAIPLTAARARIVTTAGDWPGSHYYWAERARAEGGELVVVPLDADGIGLDSQRVAEEIDDRTAVVSLSLVHFRTSYLVDLAPIVAAARAHGAIVIVDAYQAAGTVPVDVIGDDIDICVGGSVKFLSGGPGNGWVYVRPELAATLRPSVVGWISHARPFGFEAGDIDYAPGVQRFAGGTPNVPAAYAAAPAYQAVLDVGVERIRARSLSLTQPLVNGLVDAGYVVRSPVEGHRRGGHVTVDLDSGSGGAPGQSERVHDELIRRGVVVDHRPGGGIRVGPHFFTKTEECQAFLDAVAEIRAGR